MDNNFRQKICLTDNTRYNMIGDSLKKKKNWRLINLIRIADLISVSKTHNFMRIADLIRLSSFLISLGTLTITS